ncbi:MAG: DJ-1/PfpI family protein [Candidatus Diapherotrites archaeon]|nr:DJ-1/PfpI family protein [Candidatus Diapherotrites archaeon]
MKPIEGKKVLMVIAPEKFRDEELFKPKEIIEANGGIVTIASLKARPCTGMMGATITPDIEIIDVPVDAYDAIIFVGGNGAEVYFKNEMVHNMARKAVEQGKLVGAICIAPCILANAGVLHGKNATVFFGTGYVETIKGNGATYTGEKVTVDGKIITANGPMAAKEFGIAIVEALREE